MEPSNIGPFDVWFLLQNHILCIVAFIAFWLWLLFGLIFIWFWLFLLLGLDWRLSLVIDLRKSLCLVIDLRKSLCLVIDLRKSLRLLIQLILLLIWNKISLSKRRSLSLLLLILCHLCSTSLYKSIYRVLSRRLVPHDPFGRLKEIDIHLKNLPKIL